MNFPTHSTAVSLAPEAVADGLAYSDPASLDALLLRLRREDPVSQITPRGFRPFWLVTRYADIMAVQGGPDLFSAEPRTILLPEDEERRNLAAHGTIGGGGTLIHMDERHHATYRGLTHSWFMGQNLQRLDGRVQEIAQGMTRLMREKDGACDFAREIAHLYPLRVTMLVLGIPQEDEGLMLRLSEALFGRAALGTTRLDDTDLDEFTEYLTVLAQDRRANPRGDLSSVIVNGQIDGRPISDEEAVTYFLIAATAGHDTTSAVIAGGLLALIEHPDELVRLKTNPGLLSGAIEEFVRWTTPVKHFMRTATRDTELGGQAITEGQSLMLHYQSANRDEEAYEKPFDLLIDRKPNRHLAFGYGPHRCLGRYLALMEMTALYGALLPGLEMVESAGPAEFGPSYFVSGLKSLPIRYRLS